MDAPSTACSAEVDGAPPAREQVAGTAACATSDGDDGAHTRVDLGAGAGAGAGSGTLDAAATEDTRQDATTGNCSGSGSAAAAEASQEYPPGFGHDRLAVDVSAIPEAGRGLFCTAPVKKDDVVAVYTGKVLRTLQAIRTKDKVPRRVAS